MLLSNSSISNKQIFQFNDDDIRKEFVCENFSKILMTFKLMLIKNYDCLLWKFLFCFFPILNLLNVLSYFFFFSLCFKVSSKFNFQFLHQLGNGKYFFLKNTIVCIAIMGKNKKFLTINLLAKIFLIEFPLDRSSLESDSTNNDDGIERDAMT